MDVKTPGPEVGGGRGSLGGSQEGAPLGGLLGLSLQARPGSLGGSQGGICLPGSRTCTWLGLSLGSGGMSLDLQAPAQPSTPGYHSLPTSTYPSSGVDFSFDCRSCGSPKLH